MNEELPTVPGDQDKFESVTVVLRRERLKIANIRCMYCGKRLFVAHGKTISIIFEDKLVEAEEAVDVFCDRCRIVYRLA